jgi:tetratricopeptide (TPR) repeat protein
MSSSVSSNSGHARQSYYPPLPLTQAGQSFVPSQSSGAKRKIPPLEFVETRFQMTPENSQEAAERQPLAQRVTTPPPEPPQKRKMIILTPPLPPSSQQQLTQSHSQENQEDQYATWLKNKYSKAQHRTNGEDRILAYEEALASIPRAVEGSRFAEYEAFCRGLCLRGLGENVLEQQKQIENFYTAISHFQKVTERHPLFNPAQYWLGLCFYQLAERNSLTRAERFERAIRYLSKVKSREWYFDAQLWQGYCYYRLAEEEAVAKNRLEKFKHARDHFSKVKDSSHPFAYDARNKFLECSEYCLSK